MNSRLFFELETKIEEWANANTETPEMEGLNVWFSEELVRAMTSAAAIVFDSSVESQRHAKEQEKGFLGGG